MSQLERDAALADAQLIDAEPIQPRRNSMAVKNDPALKSEHAHPQHRLQNHEDARRRPCLRITRHRIWNGAETNLAPEAAEELRQTRSVQLLRRIEQTLEAFEH